MSQTDATANARATASIRINTGPTATGARTPIPAVTPAPASNTGGPLPGPARVGGSYGSLLSDLCAAFRAKNAGAVTSQLPYYQYNSGLRYGNFGDGEGQTGDPSMMGTWLAQSTVRCVMFTAAAAAHGTLLTRGWAQPGRWGLVELDTFNGHWKINDFTFGKQRDLFSAMHVAGPIYRYRG
ncbi:MAG: hypothetical protein ACR2JC_15550 [Chloroflexota bacterium]